MIRNILKFLLFFAWLLATSLTVHSENTSSWWKEVVFYQIYMPSFQDSDGDGMSDFNGMTSRLDYLQTLGIKGIWLTPFLKSPKVDNGYDVADYRQIDPVYGTIGDFKHFLEEAHRRGIRVIMDMVVNHTSTDSPWFQESRKSKNNPYRDYYIWRDKPNNWESFFGGSTWQLDSLTNQYYYHKFAVRMADLNWSNPGVVIEIHNVLRFWLDLGIDGFRFDVINFLTTDSLMTNNPVKDGKQIHRYDIDRPGVKKELRLLKSTINEYPDKFEVGEVGSDKIGILKQYQAPDLLDVVFNFNFGSIPAFSVERLFSEMQSMEKNMPGYPTLFFGSHDNPRLMNRLAGGDPKRALALAALTLTAKGVPFVYYGEEIGMENITADSYEEVADIQGQTFYHLAIKDGKTPQDALKWANDHNRDKSRSPMQWENSTQAGFTSGKPWIKIHDNVANVNVQDELNQKHSMLKTYQALIALRNKEKVLQFGGYDRLECVNQRILYTRSYAGESITVVLNFGEKTRIKLPSGARILMGTTELKTNEFLIYKVG
jgi:trehalose-6-phosphate hydrolase